MIGDVRTMLRIKLARVGKKKAPTYRLLVMERSKDPWGDSLENVGHYNPRTTPSTIELKKERIEYWLSKGAQPTESVHNILVEAGLLKDKKKNVSSLGKKFKAKVAEEKAKEAAAVAEAKAAKEAEAKAAEEAKNAAAAPAEEAPKAE